MNKPVKTLLAEDNPVNQKVALRQLLKLGITADAVANGLEVIEALQRTRYDVVFMDCQMPELDGYEATRRIRSGNALNPKVHIVALTANAMLGDREKCLESGMDDYLSKPVRLEDLQGALERSLASLHQDTDALSSPITNTTHISANKLEELRQLADPDDPDVLADIINTYLESVPGLISKLSDAIQSDLCERAAQMAHALKGSSREVGADALAALCQIVENAGKQGSLTSMESILKEIQAEFELVSAEFCQVLKNESNQTIISCASTPH